MTCGGDGARGDIGAVQRRESGPGANKAGGSANPSGPIDGKGPTDAGCNASGVKYERTATNVNSAPECRRSKRVDRNESRSNGHSASTKIAIATADRQAAGAAQSPNGHPTSGGIDGEIARSATKRARSEGDIAAIGDRESS